MFAATILQDGNSILDSESSHVQRGKKVGLNILSSICQEEHSAQGQSHYQGLK
jgi:hypothetical protein